MTTTKLNNYHALTQQIAELEAKKEALKLQIMDEMRNEGLEAVQTDFGRFTLYNVVKYTFSDDVKKAEEKVKRMKEKEKDEGTALIEETPTLRYLVNK